MTEVYKLLKDYPTYYGYIPFTVPAGTRCRWWEERQVFVFDAVRGVCIWLPRWPVVAWKDYFELEIDTLELR